MQFLQIRIGQINQANLFYQIIGLKEILNYIIIFNYIFLQIYMEKQDNPLFKFDIFNIICDYLHNSDKLTLSGVNRQFSYLLNEHLNLYFNQNELVKASERTERQNLKFYFYRNAKIIRISSLFQNKEENTFYNFFKGKNIIDISSGKNLIGFQGHNNVVYFTKTSELRSKYNNQIKFQEVKQVKKVFCQGQRMFILKQDGIVEYYIPSLDQTKIYESHEILEWTKRVGVIDIQVSYNFAIFILGKIKVADIKKQIFLEEFEEDPKWEQTKKHYVKILALNLLNWKYSVIRYPFEEIKSFCVGHNLAYFVNQKNKLLQCELNNINQGQTDLKVTPYPFLEEKSIVRIQSGLHFYIALQRTEYTLDKWDNQKVLQWLREGGFTDYINIMRVQKVDGKKLMQMDKKYMENVLGIVNTNLQQKILMSIQENQKISYKNDKLYGWGKNDTGQLANNMANYFNKPIKIKLPDLNKNEVIKDIISGWYNTIITTNENRLFITLPQKKNQKEKQEISDEQLKAEIQKEKKEQENKPGRKKKEKEVEEKKQDKKEKKKNISKDDTRKAQKNSRERYQQQPQWLEYKSTNKAYKISTFKDTLVVMQLAYKQEQHKKKIRTAKAAVDKVLWDPNIDKEQYKIGYFDKYMGILQTTVESYQKSEIKQHRIVYLKKKEQIVWHREEKIDIL